MSINFALKLCRGTVEIILFDVPLIFLPLDFPFVLFFIFLFAFFPLPPLGHGDGEKYSKNRGERSKDIRDSR